MTSGTNPPSGAALVRALWGALEARDWARLADALDPSFVATFPQSGERFDRDQWLRLNREYPGDWHIDVLNVLDAGEWVVSEVSVAIDGRIDRAVSFFRVVGGRVDELREYWPEPFPVPEWRRSWRSP
jgi:hypothetical protein